MPKFVVTGTSMEVEADSEEEAVYRAQDTSGWHWDIKEVAAERQFEARGTISIDYAMGFSEAEAREWFPEAQWDDEGASQAGWIEDLVAQGRAPQDFWDSVKIKRNVVIETDLGENARARRIVTEDLSVGEL